MEVVGMSETVVAEVRCQGRERHLLAEVVDSDAGRLLRAWQVRPVADSGWVESRQDPAERVCTDWPEPLPGDVVTSCRCRRSTPHRVSVDAVLAELVATTRRPLVLRASDVPVR
jgi:hypothetical protein